MSKSHVHISHFAVPMPMLNSRCIPSFGAIDEIVGRGSCRKTPCMRRGSFPKLHAHTGRRVAVASGWARPTHATGYVWYAITFIRSWVGWRRTYGV